MAGTYNKEEEGSAKDINEQCDIDNPEYKHVVEENEILKKRNEELVKQLDRLDFQLWHEKLGNKRRESQGFSMARQQIQFLRLRDRILFMITKKLPGGIDVWNIQ